MKMLSESAQLSELYTNHSIRSMSITKLDEGNIASQHIQAVSGHKSEATIKTYAKFCPLTKKREMFDILNLEKSKIPKVQKKTATAIVSKPEDLETNDNPLENVDFLDFVLIENNYRLPTG